MEKGKVLTIESVFFLHKFGSLPSLTRSSCNLATCFFSIDVGRAGNFDDINDLLSKSSVPIFKGGLVF